MKHRKIAVAAPWANGMVERVNRSLKNILTKLLLDPAEWKENLHKTQYIMNNTYHSSVKASPAKLMLGFEQRNHTDSVFANRTKRLADVDVDLVSEREKNRDQALDATALVRNYNKMYKDRRTKKPTQYSEGDYILIRDTVVKPGENAKLKPKYKGPYRITKNLGCDHYVIKDIEGFNHTSRPFDSILPANRIKPWIKVGPPPL